MCGPAGKETNDGNFDLLHSLIIQRVTGSDIDEVARQIERRRCFAAAVFFLTREQSGNASQTDYN